MSQLFRRQTLITIAGLSWLACGLSLMILGITRLRHALAALEEGIEGTHAIGSWLTKQTGSPTNAIVVLLAIGLTVGYLKGRFVLSKTMNRLLQRVLSLSEPAPLSKLYGFRYLLLVACMIGISVTFRLLGVPDEVRGVILIGVGSALMRGSLVAFRARSKAAQRG